MVSLQAYIYLGVLKGHFVGCKHVFGMTYTCTMAGHNMVILIVNVSIALQQSDTEWDWEVARQHILCMKCHY